MEARAINSGAAAAGAGGIPVDGILLSNHGGRQLDPASVPFHLLPTVVRELDDDLTQLARR